jgi:maltooligosyltrehalose trehalohydrolase
MTTLAMRHLPVGADPMSSGGVHFRVWAPAARFVHAVLSVGPDLSAPAATMRLEAEDHGYHSGVVGAARPGWCYKYRLDDGEALYPDPATRFQPDGPHGASMIVNPLAYRWHDGAWRGPDPDGQVVYELHLGTFTPEGTWRAAQAELYWLAELGITTLEIMPVAEFTGRFGWGYDGVCPFAPTRLYGTPDEARAFVDEAHRLGLAVVLDVVYNHFGPDGCYVRHFSPHYFSDRYEGAWGDPINFDSPESAPVREFFVSNAAYWIREFHFDGLRLDATQSIFDASDRHVVAEMVAAARRAAGDRRLWIVAENEPQDSRQARAVERGGFGGDAVWNDDFHHAARVLATGRREAYYSNYFATPQEFVSAAKYGYLYQGQYYGWQGKPRGSSALDLDPGAFVAFIENHDQVSNSARGLRLHQITGAGRWRMLTAMLLLFPSTPMLLQGAEFASSRPFLYFADLAEELRDTIRTGRFEFLSQFPGTAAVQERGLLADPCARDTFERCRLDLGERETHTWAVALHRDLIALRRGDPTFRVRRARPVDGAVLDPSSFVLRYFGVSSHTGELASDPWQDRLLLVNWGAGMSVGSRPEPLLAPPTGGTWRVLWSSEDPAYGGGGHGKVDPASETPLPGECAVVLEPVRPVRGSENT